MIRSFLNKISLLFGLSKKSIFSEVDALYKKLPELDCKGLCQECCGPILMTRLEWWRIQQRTGMSLEKFQQETSKDYVCAMLDKSKGACKVYDIRPMVCRIWGSTPKVKCPFGCQPKRWVEDEEVAELLTEVDKISARNGL